MLIIKRLLVIALSPLLTLLLLAAALDWGVVHTVGQPDQVKKLIRDSGLYNTVIPSLLNQQKSIQTSVGNIPLNDPVVKQAATKSFSPQLVQKNTESAIDNIYAWLDGKTVTPSFKFDFSSAQSSLADNLATAASDKAASLPACKTLPSNTSFDVYSATCLPRGVTPATVGQTVKDQIDAGKGFVDKPVLSASDIKNDKGQSVFASQFKDLPKQYQRIKKSPYLLLIIAAIVAVSLIFLRPTLTAGLRHVGIVFAMIGLFMLLFAWGLSKANTSVVQPKINFSNNAVAADIKSLTTDIVQAIDKNYWAFGAIYGLIGACLIIIPHWLKRRRPAAATNLPPAQAEPTQAAGAAAPPQTTKPAKRTIKIQ